MRERGLRAAGPEAETICPNPGHVDNAAPQQDIGLGKKAGTTRFGASRYASSRGPCPTPRRGRCAGPAIARPRIIDPDGHARMRQVHGRGVARSRLVALVLAPV